MEAEQLGLLIQTVIAFGAVAGAIGVLAAWGQLSILRKQLEDQRQWNKMSMAYIHPMRDAHIREMEKELDDSFVNLISRSEPLTHEDVSRLMLNEEKKTARKLSNYLNELETYCSAINMGVIDESTAKTMFLYKFRRHYEELYPFIQQKRTKLNEPTLWKELQLVVDRWSKAEDKVLKY